jgi:uncharacterized protein YjbJ (UPF0337 family)
MADDLGTDGMANQVKGAAKQVEGKARNAAGGVTGDTSEQPVPGHAAQVVDVAPVTLGCLRRASRSPTLQPPGRNDHPAKIAE